MWIGSIWLRIRMRGVSYGSGVLPLDSINIEKSHDYLSYYQLLKNGNVAQG
jgi:hypothetical protein